MSGVSVSSFHFCYFPTIYILYSAVDKLASASWKVQKFIMATLKFLYDITLKVNIMLYIFLLSYKSDNNVLSDYRIRLINF
jgi:hypothetical protein